MPTRKIAAAKKPAAKKAAPVAKKAVAKKMPQPAATATFRTKIDLANLTVGAKTVKQLARAMTKLSQTLAKMDESGAVKLEQPVTAKGALLATTDAKAAKRFGMEEGRAPRAAKTAAPAAKKSAGAKVAETSAPAKKAAAKKAAAKTRVQAKPAEAAPVAEAADAAAPAAKKRAAKKAAAKSAPGKKAARKVGANGSNEPARAAGGESAAAPETPPATDTPGAEAFAS
jgi:hypothetical protein